MLGGLAAAFTDDISPCLLHVGINDIMQSFLI